MYKFIRFFRNSMGWECVEFSTPSGAVKKRLITKKEKDKIAAGLGDIHATDNNLYAIA